jgi:hypothetical protein
VKSWENRIFVPLKGLDIRLTENETVKTRIFTCLD